MMKKLIRSVALILALVTVFLVPVSADDFDNLEGWMNILDYDTVNGSGSNTFTNSGEFVAKFYFPYQTALGTIDGIVWSSRSFSVTNNNDDPLTVTYLGSNLYRIYGSSPNWHSSYLYLKFTVSSSASMQIKSLHMANSNYMHVADVGTLTVGSSSYTMSSSTSSVTHNFPESGTSGNGQSFRAFFSSSNWKKYDYIDFYIRAWVGSLDSISCSFAGIAVPCSTTYISSDDWDWPDYYNILVRVDLRGLDRSKTDVPMLLLSGVYEIGDEQFISLLQTNGYVVTETMSPLLYYFSNLESHLTSLFSTMAQRQDAYHADLAEWQQAHDKLLTDQFSLVIQRLSGISSGIVSMTNTLKVSIDTAGINVVDKLTSFQSSMETWFSTVSGKLDQLIGGTSEGDELSQGAEDLEDQVSDIHDYEQSQQEILDNSLPEIQQAVTFTRFTAALAFVQRYINLGWSGIGDLSIIYTLPIFIGLFFFICGRLPGATRWNYRPPKDGDSP